MQEAELIPHLFRKVSGKITAVLSHLLGTEMLKEAEDITADTFLAALETWPYQGIPPEPEAWLFRVARNKAINLLKRNQLFQSKVSKEWEGRQEKFQAFSWTEDQVLDSQLQLMFSLADPILPPESQVALCLRYLCGFSQEEIASAFLTGKETVSKRLQRARDKFRENRIGIAFPPADQIPQRLDAVLTTVYLLFSEGYYSQTQDHILREELCTEAMRLMQLLFQFPPADQPRTHALYALFCFQASRFPARKNPGGEMILYDAQDEELWDHLLIDDGAYHLHQASQGDTLSSWHLEAAIAYYHTRKTDTPDKWKQILDLYDKLVKLNPSPAAALNRCYALFRVKGAAEALPVLQQLNQKNNPYYFVLLGEILAATDPVSAQEAWTRALALVHTDAEKQTLLQKLHR